MLVLLVQWARIRCLVKKKEIALIIRISGVKRVIDLCIQQSHHSFRMLPVIMSDVATVTSTFIHEGADYMLNAISSVVFFFSLTGYLTPNYLWCEDIPSYTIKEVIRLREGG